MSAIALNELDIASMPKFNIIHSWGPIIVLIIHRGIFSSNYNITRYIPMACLEKVSTIGMTSLNRVHRLICILLVGHLSFFRGSVAMLHLPNLVEQVLLGISDGLFERPS